MLAFKKPFAKFYEQNTFADKLICQLLGGKEKLQIINICSQLIRIHYKATSFAWFPHIAERFT